MEDPVNVKNNIDSYDILWRHYFICHNGECLRYNLKHNRITDIIKSDKGFYHYQYHHINNKSYT